MWQSSADCGPKLTSFDADVGAADLASLVFSGTEVVVVMDVAVVGGR